MDRLNPTATDDLSSVLRAVNLRSVVYCISELGAPWGFRVEKSVVAKFHLVLAGAAVLKVEGDDAEPVTLDAGHLVLLPHGSRHDIRDQPSSRVRGLERIVVDHPIDEHMHMTYGGSGPHTSLLCGGFDLHGSLPEELGDLLPHVLVLDSRSNGLNRWLEPTLQLLQEEHAGGSPGSTALLAKLADVFLTQILRQYLRASEATARTVRLAAVEDVAVAEAAGLMRRNPCRKWTLSSLAGEVGMSRTALATRFRDLVGEPPMTYLTQVRLGRAAGYLSTTSDSLNCIAERVGYSSESALSKAFKREYGRSPRDYRRDQLAVPIMQT